MWLTKRKGDTYVYAKINKIRNYEMYYWTEYDKHLNQWYRGMHDENGINEMKISERWEKIDKRTIDKLKKGMNVIRKEECII